MTVVVRVEWLCAISPNGVGGRGPLERNWNCRREKGKRIKVQGYGCCLKIVCFICLLPRWWCGLHEERKCLGVFNWLLCMEWTDWGSSSSVWPQGLFFLPRRLGHDFFPVRWIGSDGRPASRDERRSKPKNTHTQHYVPVPHVRCMYIVSSTTAPARTQVIFSATALWRAQFLHFHLFKELI